MFKTAADYAPYLIWTALDGAQRLYAKYDNPATSSTITETTATDEKGRKIGFKSTVRTVDYTPPAEGETVYGLVTFEHGYGRFYSVRVEMTKDGKRFGASQAPKEFCTEREAWEHAERVVEERRKKYETK
ncbi:hypothetical protein HMSP1_78 [Sinorhizobium phage HMSP1-Susan]|nr:hypothetical protein HMSP1_78 [Sinorhizobium phage HMSP1-Susan]